MDMTQEEKRLLRIVHDPLRRPALLACLERLGLLESFFEAERGVKQDENNLTEKEQ